jgi:hypothetical protein
MERLVKNQKKSSLKGTPIQFLYCIRSQLYIGNGTYKFIAQSLAKSFSYLLNLQLFVLK